MYAKCWSILEYLLHKVYLSKKFWAKIRNYFDVERLVSLFYRRRIIAIFSFFPKKAYEESWCIRYFIIDQQIVLHFVHFSEWLYHPPPLLLCATKKISLFFLKDLSQSRREITLYRYAYDHEKDIRLLVSYKKQQMNIE